jgi:hypothetical protein
MKLPRWLVMQSESPSLVHRLTARRGTALLGTELRTLDEQVFGVLDDTVIDRDGRIPFVTTTFSGGVVAIPFAALWLAGRPGLGATANRAPAGAGVAQARRVRQLAGSL